MLIAAIVLITSALAFYTTGVWTERRAGVLSLVHAALFATGLAFDASGTYVMGLIASSAAPGIPATVGPLGGVMEWTGALALGLMALHLTWAIVVLLRNRPGEKAAFHRFSIAVWTIWLIPYVAGMLGAML